MKPFKVKCILELPGKCRISGEPMPVPQVGDCDLVVSVVNAFGHVVYELERFGFENLYWSQAFATLPDTTEEIATEHEQEAIIYQR